MQKKIQSIEHAMQLIKVKKCGKGSKAFYQFHIQTETLTDNAKEQIRELLETVKNKRQSEYLKQVKPLRMAFATLILGQ